jgi:hypothetical protein
MNLLIAIAFQQGIIYDYTKTPVTEKVGVSFCTLLFVISIITFLISIFVQPGYLKPYFEIT